MSKRQREETPWCDLPSELWPEVLGHLMFRDDACEASTNAEWILNWLATHRDAARKMQPYLARWLCGVLHPGITALKRFAKRRSARTLTALHALGDNCADDLALQCELAYVVFIAQREDELVYSCGSPYRSASYCTQGDVNPHTPLARAFFPHAGRLHPMLSARVYELVPVSPQQWNCAMDAMTPLQAFLSRKASGGVPNQLGQRALDWSILASTGEYALTREVCGATELRDLVVCDTPLYAPHSPEMAETRDILCTHDAAHLTCKQRCDGLAMWLRRRERNAAIWTRLAEHGDIPDSSDDEDGGDDDEASSDETRDASDTEASEWSLESDPEWSVESDVEQ